MEAGDVARITECLKAGADPAWKNGGALGMVVRSDSYDLIPHFVSPGQTIPVELVSDARERGRYQTFEALTAAGASYLDEHGRCPVLQSALEDSRFYGVEGSCYDIIKSILDTRPNVAGTVIPDQQWLSILLESWLECEGLKA